MDNEIEAVEDESDILVEQVDDLRPILNDPDINISVSINLNNIKKSYIIIPKNSIQCMCKPMKQKEIMVGEFDHIVYPSEIPPPIYYFMKYFTDEAFSEMAIYTNIYANQKHTTNWTYTTVSEMKLFVGAHIMMGTL